MTEIIKAPTNEEAKLLNDKLDKDSDKYIPEFIEDVINQINEVISANNFVEYSSPTIEISWGWYNNNYKDKIRERFIYSVAQPIIMQKLDEAGYSVFYSGGGDRVYYFTITPKSIIDITKPEQ